MEFNEKIMKRVQEHYDYLESKGYEIVFLGLYGSPNYDLDIYTDEYMSDVDTKAIVLPSFSDFVNGYKPVSTTIELDNEHIDTKDVRNMHDCFKKQNVNFIELLFTDYMIVNPKYQDIFQEILDNAEGIARLNVNQALRCISGMSTEKLHALKHPYPSIIDKIEKYGYDPKQAHHVVRLNQFIKKYISGLSYRECLKADNKEWLIDIKLGKFDLDTIEKLCIKLDAETKEIKDNNIVPIDFIDIEMVNLLDKVKYELLKRRFKEELNKGE